MPPDTSRIGETVKSAAYAATVDEQGDPSPATCCSPAETRIAQRFDRRARTWTDAPELPAMVDVSAGLRRLLLDVATRRPTILELGCGTGALSVALLADGARAVTGIDLSPGSIALARRRAEQARVGQRATFRVGNAALETVDGHDWVVLDRSICCFPHVERLLDAALSAQPERIAISLPESRGWRGAANRILWRAENLWDIVSGGCPGYVHDLRRIERRLAAGGLVPLRSGRIGLWFCGIYQRAS